MYLVKNDYLCSAQAAHQVRCFNRSVLFLIAAVFFFPAAATLDGGRAGAKPPANWPPRIIYNTDGNWVIKRNGPGYMERRRPEDITDPHMKNLADTNVDALEVLVGIDDDLSWRGKHGQLWCDNVKNWDFDETYADAKEKECNRLNASVHKSLAAVIEDGHDLMQIYIDAARREGMAIFATFRMNDGHTGGENNFWHGRSQMKLDRPDLLLGSLDDYYGNTWGFNWQWDYAKPEVRQRFLGLFDETLTRYDFDAIVLDFCRAPNFFSKGRIFKNIPTMTDFMRKARAIVDKHSARKGRPVRLIVRVPTSIDMSLEIGLDTETWIREKLADIFVLASSYCCGGRIDIDRAVACANGNGVLIYTGFDSATCPVGLPVDGQVSNPTAVLRATALAGYNNGASGVHIFNYDYPSHRPKQAKKGFDKQPLRDLADAKALERLDRLYVSNKLRSPGDYPPQLPRTLALVGRGAGPGHAVRMMVGEDIAAGLADGSIKKTELRLQLSDHEKCMDRIIFKVNGNELALGKARTKSNWFIVDNPPLQEGENTILLALEGVSAPPSWPKLNGCEILVKCSDE